MVDFALMWLRKTFSSSSLKDQLRFQGESWNAALYVPSCPNAKDRASCAMSERSGADMDIMDGWRRRRGSDRTNDLCPRWKSEVWCLNNMVSFMPFSEFSMLFRNLSVNIIPLYLLSRVECRAVFNVVELQLIWKDPNWI